MRIKKKPSKPGNIDDKTRKALDKLLHSDVYYALAATLAQLENRMSRLESLLHPPEGQELPADTYMLLLTQQEAVLNAERWTLHNQIRALVWELERLR